MKKGKPKAVIYISGAVVLFLTGLYYEYHAVVPDSSPRARSPAIAVDPLYTQGNRILSAKTHAPIKLRGVVSDYFRYGFNNGYPQRYGGLDEELARIEDIRQAGADINIVGLYLAGLDETKSNMDELDRYIASARENGLYVFLAPAGIGFRETNPQNRGRFSEDYWSKVGENDLAELTEFLASRYGHFPHILYQLTAEPDGLLSAAWEAKQKELADIVRKHTKNLIIVSRPGYGPYKTLPALPHENVVYSMGGYISRNDDSFVERQIDDILGDKQVRQQYPAIVAEFGGNYGSDFSSPRDLALFKDLLDAFNREHMNYTAYRLMSAFEHDGLALFDTEGDLTAKGRMFVDAFD